MEDNTLVKSSFSATINAPIEKVDIPSWCFALPESEYQSCSPAHCSAGATTAPDGRRMSINVEILGGSLMVQHCVEEIGEPDHLRLVSTSDVFTPTGRTKIGVIWDLSVRKIDDKTCEFTNMVHSSATPELMDFSKVLRLFGLTCRGSRESGNSSTSRLSPASPAANPGRNCGSPSPAMPPRQEKNWVWPHQVSLQTGNRDPKEWQATIKLL